MKVTTSLIDAALKRGASRVHIMPRNFTEPVSFQVADGDRLPLHFPEFDIVFEDLRLVAFGHFEGNIVYGARTIRYFQKPTTSGPYLVLILEPFADPVSHQTRPDIVIPATAAE